MIATRSIFKCNSPAPRRLVLLAADGSDERVLAEVPADKLHDEIRRVAREHPGRVIAGEWLGRLGWVRFLLVSCPSCERSVS